MKKQIIINTLKEEVKPAMGCTEPVAIALTAAKAYQHVNSIKIQKMKITVSSNIYKNARSVGIPGTTKTGVKTAALLGVSIEKPELNLNIFSSLTNKEIKKAEELKNIINTEIQINNEGPKVYVEIEIKTDSEKVRAIISHRHTNLVLLQKDKEIIIDNREPVKEEESVKTEDIINYSLAELIKECLNIESVEFDFLHRGIELNMDIAREGLKMNRGLKAGKVWSKLYKKGLIGNDLNSRIAQYTSSACDARMAGVQKPVMTSAGSGNQGLVAVIPIGLVAEEYNSSNEDILYALAISHLVTIYIKEYIGRLSPVCGCSVAAGAGAGAGLVYLMGGDPEDISRVIKNIISTVAGMICDGGKVGCALKLCISAASAWWNALFALEGMTVPANNGILADSLQQTVTNMKKLSEEGMKETDNVILSIMRESSV